MNIHTRHTWLVTPRRYCEWYVNIHTSHTWLADLVQSGYLVRMLVFTHDMNSLKTWMAWRGKVKGNGGRVLTWMCIIILGYYGGRTKKCHEISYIFYPLAGMFHTFTSRDQSCQNNIYGSKLSGWEILTFCVNFCQFSLWPGVKISYRRPEKKVLCTLRTVMALLCCYSKWAQFNAINN